jgi:general secretion pathway protein G
MQAKRGFTLVEILIVVVILGILAAIVIPQFTQASTEAKVNSLCSDLQTLRSQIELYKVQHNDIPPGNTIAADGTFAGAVTSFENQMIFCTDVRGQNAGTPSKARDTGVAQIIYGPYLERIPDNPFNNQNGVALAAGATVGWTYDPATGVIKAADGGKTADVLHSDM